MKLKYCFLLLLSFLFLLGGCNKKEPEGRLVTLEEIGLSYRTPGVWMDYEETNLYPLATSEDGIFAKVTYFYITDTGLESIINGASSEELMPLLHDICTIAVLKEENKTLQNVKELFAMYDKQELAAEQNGYSYYALFEYNGDLSDLSDTEKQQYDDLAQAVPTLVDSIAAFDFDDTALEQKSEELGRTITFISKTLEGEDINSSVFADYTLTMVNFWGTNAYPNINEQETLQELYEKLEDYPQVHLISAITDTPSPENEAVALKAKQEAKGQFTSLMMDETLATWVVNHLQGIPTTIFVDENAKIVGDYVEGVRTADEYMDEILTRLKELEETES